MRGEHKHQNRSNQKLSRSCEVAVNGSNNTTTVSWRAAGAGSCLSLDRLCLWGYAVDSQTQTELVVLAVVWAYVIHLVAVEAQDTRLAVSHTCDIPVACRREAPWYD